MVDATGCTSQGVRHQCFLALMLDALGSPSAPYSGSAVDVFYVDGGRSCISVSTSQGVCRRCFLALMVDAHGFSAPAPPRGAIIDVFYVNSGHS
jgi:hypothetical protein